MVDALGKILGEEVVRVAGAMQTSPEARIRGAQQVATCPGRRVEDGPRPRTDYKFTDADPVKIRLGLLTHRRRRRWRASPAKSSIRSTSTSAKQSPAPRTIMITHANGSSGYIPDDTGFEQIGYEVTTSHLKPGCAENAIVNGVIEMMPAQVIFIEAQCEGHSNLSRFSGALGIVWAQAFNPDTFIGARGRYWAFQKGRPAARPRARQSDRRLHPRRPAARSSSRHPSRSIARN